MNRFSNIRLPRPCKHACFLLLMLFLSACGGGVGARTETPVPSQLPANTLPATITTTPLPVAKTALPTFTPLLLNWTTPTTIPSPAPLPIATGTEIFLLDNLRMAYIVDGNLYVQNGSNPPKKLSDSVKDWSPMFSDDGEKIVFYRGTNLHDYNSIFSVNADGSRIQEIITTAWLDTLGAGTKAGHLAFVPNTHQIFFNTYLCPENDDMYSGCIVGLFHADTDTGNLKEIVEPTLGGRLLMDGDSRWGGNFSISPDGKLISIAHAGQIDILSIDGKVIHHNIMEYLPGIPVELYPRVYWLSDSSGLIAALPAEKEYKFWVISGDPAYTIWRYTFDSNVATQIPLNPSLSWAHMESNDIISISPNREWIVYFTNEYQLYKGNLLDGNTELLLPYRWFLPTLWSSDNIHFADLANPEGNILGSVNAPPGYPPGHFLGWIDTEQFIYFPPSAYASKDDIPVFVGEINGKMVNSYETKVFVANVAPYSYAFTFTILKGNK